MVAAARLREAPPRPFDRPPSPSLGLPTRAFLLGAEEGRLLGQLAPAGEAAGVELARLERRAHRAAGLALVAAIAEPAERGQLLNLGEGSSRFLFVGPELELTQPGSIDDERSLPESVQPAARRRVPSPLVLRSDLAGPRQGLSREGVQQSRLAGARGADQDGRPTGRECEGQIAEAEAGGSADQGRPGRGAATAASARSRPGSAARSAFVRTSTGWAFAARASTT